MHIRLGFISAVAAITLVGSGVAGAPAASAQPVQTAGANTTLTGPTSFPSTLVGRSSASQDIVIHNNSGVALTVRLRLDGAIFDFVASASCEHGQPGTGITLTPIPAGGVCTLTTTFSPLALGLRTGTLGVDEVSPVAKAQVVPDTVLTGTGVEGYYVAGASGEVAAEGAAPVVGDLANDRLNAPIVGSAMNGSGGYWLTASDGGIFTFGGAGFFGSTGAIKLGPARGWDGGDTQRARLLVGCFRWRGVHFWRRQVFRFDRCASTERADRGDGGDTDRVGVLVGCFRRWDLQFWRRPVLWFDRCDSAQPADRGDGGDTDRVGLLVGCFRWRGVHLWRCPLPRARPGRST